MSGSSKLLLLGIVIAVAIVLLPLILAPLPYDSLDWVEAGSLLYNPTEEPAPPDLLVLYLPLVADHN